MHVARTPGVIGVLQGAPVEAEGPIAGEPAGPGEIEAEPKEGLHPERKERFRPDPDDMFIADVAYELAEPPPPGRPVLKPAAAEYKRANEVDEPGDRNDRPIESGQQAIDPIGLQPAG